MNRRRIKKFAIIFSLIWEVIKIHPHSPSARYHIDALKAELRNQMI